MDFEKSVKKTPKLENAWMTGLGALRTRDKRHVQPESPRQLKGSVDVDGALVRHEPNSSRWDFGIGYRHSDRSNDCIYWVEVHTGDDKEVKVVLNKLTWLQKWLKGPGKLLNE